MSTPLVTPVTTRAQQKQFINLPWTLYAGDPNWVPPLLAEHKRLLGFKHHPFYDDGAIQTFLATRGNQVVGRIAAIVNNVHNRRAEELRGFFGFFESIEDQEVANSLFDAAAAWLKERGMTAVCGVRRIPRSTTSAGCWLRDSIPPRPL